MKLSNVLNIVLALALVFTSYQLAIAPSKGAQGGNNSGKAVIENIMTRTSIRKYTDKKISKEQLDTLVRAGMAAPTAANKQPWHFTVVTDKALLKKLGGDGRNAEIFKSAQAAIVVSGDLVKALDNEARDMWIEDTSAATENILLAAHAMGLGAVWTGVYPVAEREEHISKVLNLPENLEPMSCIVLGYPAESPAPKDKYKASNVLFK